MNDFLHQCNEQGTDRGEFMRTWCAYCSSPNCMLAEVHQAAKTAAAWAHENSGCLRSRRGAVVWQPGSPICWTGANQPALGVCDGTDECKATCGRTCVHAEQAALLKNPQGNAGSEMLHVKVDAKGDMVPSGGPSCDQCSKLILHAGVAGMWLLHKDGWRRYTAQEFHELTLEACRLNRRGEVESGTGVGRG